MRALVRQRRLLPLSGGAAVLVCAVAVSLGLQVSGYGLLPDPGAGGSDGRGLFAGQDVLPPLTGRFTGETSGRAAARVGGGGTAVAAAAPAGPRAGVGEGTAPAQVPAGPRVSNDDVARARQVVALPYEDRADARSREQDEPSSCTSSGPTAWYRLQSTRSLALVASATGSSSTLDRDDSTTGLGVFTGDRGPAQQVGCSTRDGTVYVQTRPGTTYWFQVAAPEVAAVSFLLRAQGVNRLASATPQGAVPDGRSVHPQLSDDGSTLLFVSSAQDLHPGVDPTCRSSVELVNDATGGGRLPTSTDHRLVGAGSCKHLYARDLRTGALELLDRRPDGRSGGDTVGVATPASSRDGRFVAFWLMANDVVPGDTNPGMDLVVRDRRLQRWHLLRAPDGSQPVQARVLGPPPVLSPGGRYVVFAHGSPQLGPATECGPRLCRQLYRWDLHNGQVVRISRTPAGAPVRDSKEPVPVAVTDDGRLVTYVSDAPDVVAGDTNGAADVFQHDVRRGSTLRVSLSADGRQLPTGVSAAHRQVDVSADGRFLAFRTADAAVADDRNEQADVYVRDVRTGAVTAASVDSAGEFGYALDPAVHEPFLSLSDDGRWVAFVDAHRDLVERDVNRDADVFLRDRRTGSTRIVVLWPDGSQPAVGWSGFAPSLSADGRLLAFSGGRMDGRPESGCYCSQVWTRSLR